jgi:protein TonB
MIRKSRSLLASVALHALLIALLIGTAYEVRELTMPPSEGRISFSLHHYNASPPPTISKPHNNSTPIPKKPIEAPKPVAKNVVEPVKKSVVLSHELPQPNPMPKPEPSSVEAPKKIVEEAPIAREVAQAHQSYEQTYVQNHLAVIASLLQEHLYYPRIARQRGLSGEVMVAFEVLPNGEADRIEVLEGSHIILNRAAVQTIESLSGKFPKPKERLTLHVPIRYQLH